MATTTTSTAGLSGNSSSGGYHAYNDITPRVGVYASAYVLKRGRSTVKFDTFMQHIPIPKNKSKTIKMRRWKSLAPATTPLSEGVTPTAQSMKYEDVYATLNQYGGVMKFTDVVIETHEDPVLKEMCDVMGDQAGDTANALNWNILKSGTNVYYSGSAASRGAVEATITKALFRKVSKQFRRDKARQITRALTPSDKIDTHPISPCFIAYANSDLKSVFEDIDGFIPVEKYAVNDKMDGEIGKIDDFRIIITPDAEPIKASGKPGTTNVSNGELPSASAAADVYPIICIAQDSVAVTPLSGMDAVSVKVVNPSNTIEDPLAQRGAAGWKMWHAGTILNEAWAARIEVALAG